MSKRMSQKIQWTVCLRSQLEPSYSVVQYTHTLLHETSTLVTSASSNTNHLYRQECLSAAIYRM